MTYTKDKETSNSKEYLTNDENIQNSLVSLAKYQLIQENSRILNLMRRRLGDKLMNFVYDENLKED